MKYKNIAVKAVVFVGIILLAAVFVYKFGLVRNINISDIEQYIRSYGRFAALIYVVIFAARTLLVFFPYSIMVILGGSIFGPAKGFLYSMLSIFISANIAFFLSRFLGKSFIQRLLRGKVKELDQKVEKHGLKIIFFMRISSLFPYDILNYAAGLTKVKYRDFMIGTLLGIIPETFSLTFLGDNLKNPFSWKFIVAIALVLLTVAVPLTINKVKSSRKNKRTHDDLRCS